jgi:hypothetical protein
MDMRSDASIIDTGSSATMSLGSGISARATATRCSWPPESSCGKRPLISANERPTRCSASSARPYRRSTDLASLKRRAVANRYSSIRLSGLKASKGFWKTGWTLAMKASRLARLRNVAMST